MDAVSVEKVASASVFFDPKPGNTIVDVGMASGTSSNILALLFPQQTIIGVDINPKMVEIASETYQLPNLEFRMDDGEKLHTFSDLSVNGFFNCSSIHHITSFNGYDPYRAYSTLKRQAELLKSGGIIVVRDFVKPPEMEVILDLSDKPQGEKPGDAELLLMFAKTARSLSIPSEIGFPVKEISSPSKVLRRFQLHFADAVEFIRRKDYWANWEIELQEEYGYFTQKEFEEIFANLGLRTIVSYPIYNPWIIQNRYRNQFSLYDKGLNDLGFPPTNYLIAGEKVGDKGSGIHLVRHLPETEIPFLNYTSYLDSHDGKVFDVVSRPQSVTDILPFIKTGNTIEILAKHGYPRPIVNVETDSPLIDGKHYGGYITEGITAINNRSVALILAERINLQPTDILSIENSLEYFTSPGGINEIVQSVFVKLTKALETEVVQKSFSGFTEGGSVRKYDASQLLKTAQTGALVEARLELNVYHLFKKLGHPLPEWLGGKITLKELKIIPSALEELFAPKNVQFEPSLQSAGYLQKHRGKFTETGVFNSFNVLEYVVPQQVSVNTLVTLPVALFCNEIYVGLEMRHLPVPQLHLGNSCIPVAPAYRLPKTISSFKHLEDYILELEIYNASIISFTKLGEKLFPSVGITPEQVYPYIVSLTKSPSELKWIRLSELMDNLDKIRDGHLLVSLFRLSHALS